MEKINGEDGWLIKQSKTYKELLIEAQKERKREDGLFTKEQKEALEKVGTEEDLELFSDDQKKSLSDILLTEKKDDLFSEYQKEILTKVIGDKKAHNMVSFMENVAKLENLFVSLYDGKECGEGIWNFT